ncbi:hypothetical protein [Streptomyces sp. NRRL S-31]|uniref:hypothetical protein n=1 Tax=Streptomyces sp. NRRL S-31 TaxID=1463898 RepID=UPI0004C4B098|nr:hypothetical protein [Streptomyces sp. NRRL S-31]
MQYIVHQEAGSVHAALGQRLERIVAETAPLVTAVTGLPLPEPVVIRTMKVRDWRRAHRRSSKQHLVEEALRLGVTSRTEAQVIRRARSIRRRLFWPAMLGESVAFEAGHPEVIILPEALQHAGRLDDGPVLHKLLGHEMTHLAQYAASGGAIWEAQDTYFPDVRGTADRDYGYLVEGHAYWADRQITARLFGEPVSTDVPSPTASARYLKLFNSPLRTRVVERQRRATDNVAEIITGFGLDTFNLVWTRSELVPRTSDTITPEAWKRRFDPRDEQETSSQQPRAEKA